jgi:hypothetical protein
MVEHLRRLIGQPHRHRRTPVRPTAPDHCTRCGAAHGATEGAGGLSRLRRRGFTAQRRERVEWARRRMRRKPICVFQRRQRTQW